MKHNNNDRNVPFIPLTRDKFDQMGMIIADPMGSYTGRAIDPHEKPVQDVDDL